MSIRKEVNGGRDNYMKKEELVLEDSAVDTRMPQAGVALIDGEYVTSGGNNERDNGEGDNSKEEWERRRESATVIGRTVKDVISSASGTSRSKMPTLDAFCERTGVESDGKLNKQTTERMFAMALAITPDNSGLNITGRKAVTKLFPGRVFGLAVRGDQQVNLQGIFTHALNAVTLQDDKKPFLKPGNVEQILRTTRFALSDAGLITPEKSGDKPEFQKPTRDFIGTTRLVDEEEVAEISERVLSHEAMTELLNLDILPDELQGELGTAVDVYHDDPENLAHVSAAILSKGVPVFKTLKRLKQVDAAELAIAASAWSDYITEHADGGGNTENYLQRLLPAIDIDLGEPLDERPDISFELAEALENKRFLGQAYDNVPQHLRDISIALNANMTVHGCVSIRRYRDGDVEYLPPEVLSKGNFDISVVTMVDALNRRVEAELLRRGDMKIPSNMRGLVEERLNDLINLSDEEQTLRLKVPSSTRSFPALVKSVAEQMRDCGLDEHFGRSTDIAMDAISTASVLAPWEEQGSHLHEYVSLLDDSKVREDLMVVAGLENDSASGNNRQPVKINEKYERANKRPEFTVLELAQRIYNESPGQKEAILAISKWGVSNMWGDPSSHYENRILMLVGPSGGGKTEILQTISKP